MTNILMIAQFITTIIAVVISIIALLKANRLIPQVELSKRILFASSAGVAIGTVCHCIFLIVIIYLKLL